MKKINFLRALRKNGTSFGINIPPEVIKILGLKEGDLLKVDIEKIPIK